MAGGFTVTQTLEDRRALASTYAIADTSYQTGRLWETDEVANASIRRIHRQSGPHVGWRDETWTYDKANSSGFLPHIKAPVGAEALSARRKPWVSVFGNP